MSNQDTRALVLIKGVVDDCSLDVVESMRRIRAIVDAVPLAPCGCDPKALTYRTCRKFVDGAGADRCVLCGHRRACHGAREAQS